MYIEEIVLEGFKSYATRTVISGWDPQFNAITGLNGSGKSNILDAICFVLGIDNLRQVRATSMQDLIYKRGQSGITKASVTLVFNNSDPAQSPIGYADQPQITVTRQVIVGGKHKYLVNGHNALNKVVENLFQSVQLNVNNPHFLIMQGQITKVLNMKPPEILALIEETAGTRMFEDRRGKALSTIEKKEKKVDEIASLLKEIIEPRLTTLRAERAQYLEYKRAEADIDRLRKVIVAYDFYTKSQELRMQQENEAALQSTLQEFEAEAEALVQRLADLTAQAKALKKEKESKNAALTAQIKELEEGEHAATNEVIRISTQISLKREQLKGQSGESEKAAKSLKKEQASLEAISKELEKQKAAVGKIQISREQQAVKTRQSEDLVQSLMTGVSVVDDGTGATGFNRLVDELQTQLNEAKRRGQSAEARVASIDEEMKSLEPQLKKASGSSHEIQGKLQREQARIAELKQRMEANGTNDAAADLISLRNEKNRWEQVIAEERAKIDRLRGVVGSVSFKYRDPHPGFDRSLVRGPVAELVSLTEEAAEEYGVALEIAAGAKLHHVVVETDTVAKTLLDKPGVLTRRTTMIPLNRIQPRTLSAEKEAAAAALAPNRVRSALSLIGPSDASLEPAMRFVFGSTLICDDEKAAALCAFDGRVCARAVTVAGDVYEPSGTLTGGSRPSTQTSSLLEAMVRSRGAQEALARAEAALAQVRARLEAIETAQDTAAQLANDLQLAEAGAAMLARQLAQCASGQLLGRVQRLGAERAELEQQAQQALAAQAQLREELQRAQRDAQELQEDRTAKMAGLQEALQGAQALLAAEEQRLAQAEGALQELVAEGARAQAACQRLQASVQGGQASRLELLGELGALEAALTGAEGRAAALGAQLQVLRQQAAQMDAALAAVEGERRGAAEHHERLQLLISKVRDDCARLADEIARFAAFLGSMARAHAWIADVEGSFGASGGAFDFAALNVEESRRALAGLEARQEQLKRHVNPHVLDMIDRVELKEAALRKMLATVHRDRHKIEATISTLDDFKAETLRRTWTRVNEDFGAILADLLPGAFCRLAPVGAGVVEVADVAQADATGLDIRVRLGSVWKESLVELSGGQRSLTALALILALLQYRPAPMYILDEVDAALDLSHTQNIGNLLKRRFKGSQFIVVSLKEGMFSNANVLFRTRFRDGISSVERIAQVSDSADAPIPSLKRKPAVSKGRPRLPAEAAACE